MRVFALAFLAGTLWLQQSAELPSRNVAALAVALLLSALLVRGYVRVLVIAMAGLVAGHECASWQAGERLADALPREWEGRDIEIEGIVSGLPQPGERGTRFLFDPLQVTTPGARIPSRLSLSWYVPRGKDPDALRPPEIRAGERWRMAVRLKRPRGLANPHTFDFEPWALERGIRATGYVRAAPLPVRVAEYEPGWPQSLHRFRGAVRDSMRASLGDARFTGVLVALAIGDQDAIAQEDWQVFWRTGVGHLVSISGLHVTMFASLALAITTFLWLRIPPLALMVPARKAGAVVGVAAALAYTLAAGYGVPAQRTFLMLATAAVFLLADRISSPSRILATAVVAVLLVDPWAVLAPGFWLSFGAVGAILFSLALRTGTAGLLREAAITQLAVTLALWPLLAAWFGETSVVSPLANAFAIPVVSLLVVPLTLAGALLPAPGLLTVAHLLMEVTMVPLEWLAALPGAVTENAEPPVTAVALAGAGALLLLAPRGLPLRSAGIILMLPLALFRAPVPANGEAWIDVLDVGQGLAVVVRTASHAIAYDAGPAWNSESDGGNRIVVPFLRGEGVRRLDALVITHADDDHAGGAASVATSREVPWLVSTLAQDDWRHELAPISTECLAGLRWEWDGVAFTVLHPRGTALQDRKARENDRSCVLRVDTEGASILLTGDIEWRAEAELVAADRARLRSDVLLVPHHGSRTSSSPAFLEAVSPRIALVSAGWRNRFGQPAAPVLARYAARGTRIQRTDIEGALRVTLPATPVESASVRRLAWPLRYWSDRRAG